VELPGTAMGSEACVCSHEGHAEAVAGQSGALIQLEKPKGLESECKLIICYFLEGTGSGAAQG